MTICTEKHHPNYPIDMAQTVGTRDSARRPCAICTMHTRIMSMNMSSQSTPQIPCTARLNSAAHTCTALIVDTKRYRMVTTSITL